jgi:ComEC/Rec2-related protein
MVIGKTVANPFFCATVACAVAVYCGIPIKNRKQFSSVVPSSAIVSMKGKVVSNPVKLPRMQKYAMQFEPESVKTLDGITSTCSGEITVLLDNTIVEAYFPGKVYSLCRNKGALICENGALAVLTVKAGKNNVFFANKGCMLGFTNNLDGKIAHIRALCRMQFRRLMYAWESAGGLLLALLSGIREYTNEQIADSFRKAGLSHILALSGMHLSIFSGLAVFTGSRLCGKKAAYFFQICAVLLFVWFAGLSPSLLRALLCSIILMLLSLCSIKNVSMVLVLCVSFLIHTIISPSDCTNAAFMLSYGALAGILLFRQIINRKMILLMPEYISTGVSASAAAQMFTAPVSLKLFGFFAPVGILASIVVSPFITVFIYTGLFCILLCLLFPVFVIPAGVVLNSIYTIIKKLVTVFSNM